MSQALRTSTARLGSGARATLELVAAAMAGEGHLDAPGADGIRRRPVELALRRLPALVAVLLLAAVVLTVIGVLMVLTLAVRLVSSAVSALGPRQRLVAIH
ncbi:hypothetical protein PlfCFBP13513_16635 [Plantibacter flavus]|nr:hypothetical protein PlfCFBP13513_16635 [Plantibacter flavus]